MLLSTNLSAAVAQSRRSRREQAERLLDLARHLPSRDRFLIEQLFRHGLPVPQVAAVCGRRPARLRRHVRRLLRRLHHPLFVFLAKHGSNLPPEVRRTAELVLFSHRSLRQAADLTEQNLCEVRRHIDALRFFAQIE